jgi:hypothetical protein
MSYNFKQEYGVYFTFLFLAFLFGTFAYLKYNYDGREVASEQKKPNIVYDASFKL